MLRRLIPSVVTLSVLLVVSGAGTIGAAPPDPGPPADSIDEKRQRARDLQAEIDANGARISSLAEELNGAQYRLDLIDAQIDDAQARIDDAKAEVAARRELVNRRAAIAYKRAGTAGPLDLIDVSDPQERNARAKYSGAAAASDAKLVAELQQAQTDLAEHKKEQESARDEAARERDELAEKTAEIQEANAAQALALNSVTTDLRALIADERARREAELVAIAPGTPPPPPVADAPIARVPTPPDPPPRTPPPPPTARAEVAIEFARAQLGKPYCYGGNGWGRGAPFNCPPGTFDCSGLTMRAWGAAGVRMPQYSGAQYAMFPRVALTDLHPGDLVFYGPGGSQHVGLYIGFGQMIHAPHTGDVVRVAPIHRSSGGPVGAVRPG